jgi:YYY domain-containing protein
VGYTLWIGTSIGLLRNLPGGAWLALALVGIFALAVHGQPRQHLSSLRQLLRQPHFWVAESLFLVAYGSWSVVRAYDPAANHTEQPMDLMFMNSIWQSTSFPPADAWLAGYPISYYYFGYWLMVTLGKLTNTPPAIGYNVGQAVWYGLLLTGAYGIASNLLTYRTIVEPVSSGNLVTGGRFPRRAMAGGIVASIAVGVAGNLQGILEWAYANGLPVEPIARWIQVNNFPAGSGVTNQWYVSFDWWWWRSSRIIADRNATGGYMDVISEMPIFSYVLGDNHPHVLAMPFALLALAMAANILLRWHPKPIWNNEGDGFVAWTRYYRSPNGGLALVPLGWLGLGLYALVVGSLISLNTWDFPIYWVLTGLCYFVVLGVSGKDSQWLRLGQKIGGALFFAACLLIGAIILYLPYLITAQSQAGGLGINLFNPTRLSQFLLIFGGFIPALLALQLHFWLGYRPSWRQMGWIAIILGGIAVMILVGGAAWASTERGRTALSGMALPEGATSYLPIILQRWSGQGYTLLAIILFTAPVAAYVWGALVDSRAENNSGTRPASRHSDLFVAIMLLAGCGLIYLPEFVFLLDNFGTRMNTVFKFYYQAWMLFGLCVAYAVVVAGERLRSAPLVPLLATLSCVLIGASLIYPAAAVYSKTYGFAASQPTWDATAYLRAGSEAEWLAVQWVTENVPASALVVEGKGLSYQSNYNRISTMTGRLTLLGWDGHEAQWRGRDFGRMAAGRDQALNVIYRNGTPEDISSTLAQWEIDYVYLGPAERAMYEIVPRVEERIAAAMDLVFSEGEVRIYRRRS